MQLKSFVDLGRKLILVLLVANVATAAPKPKERPLAPTKAPPRVLEGILGFLKTPVLNFALSGSTAKNNSNESPNNGSPRSEALGNSAVGSGSNASTNGSALTGAGALGGNPNGAGSSGAAKSTNNSDDDKVGFEENNQSPNADKANGAAANKGGGNAPKDSGLEPKPLVYPVCVFIDSTSQGAANQAIKGMVDKAAECGVIILPFPVATTFTMGDNEKKINEEQRKACNIPPELGTEGKGSATSFVPWPLTAARMCEAKDDKGNYDPQVAGCAEVRAAQGKSGEDEVGSDPQSQSNYAAQKAGGGAQNRGGDPIAVSIEVPLGHNDVVLSHEALGHSQMGRPNGATLGMGIGRWGEAPQGEDKSGSGGWTGAGCKALADNAFPNTKNYMYDRNRELYFVPQTERLYLLGAEPPIFTPKNLPPLPGPSSMPPLAGGEGATGGGGRPGGGLGGSEALVSRPPLSVNGGVGQGSQSNITDKVANAGLGSPKPAGRHEVKGGSAPTLSDIRKQNPPKEPPRDDSFAAVTPKSSGSSAPPASFGGGGSGERVRIDESASAGTAISTVSSGGSAASGSIFGSGSSGGSTGFGGGGGGKVGFDETMTATGPTSAVGSQPKLYLGKSGPPGSQSPPGGFQSGLSGDFFSKAKLGDGDDIAADSRRRPRGNRPSRGIASDGDAGGEVRSLRR